MTRNTRSYLVAALVTGSLMLLPASRSAAQPAAATWQGPGTARFISSAPVDAAAEAGFAPLSRRNGGDRGDNQGRGDDHGYGSGDHGNGNGGDHGGGNGRYESREAEDVDAQVLWSD